MNRHTVTDEPFAAGYMNSGTDDIYVSTGAGYLEAAKCVAIYFDADTGFPFFGFGDMGCSTSFSSGQSPNASLLKAKAEKDPENAHVYYEIARSMGKFDVGARMWESFTDSEKEIIDSCSGWGGTWGGHAVPDLFDFARLGTNGIREKIIQYKGINRGKENFYDGLLLTLDAIDILGKRIRDAAAAEYKATGNKKLCKIISAFEKCPTAPAETFADAVCVYAAIFCLDGIDSPGHFDQYMIDFWRASDIEESREALDDLWVFFHKTRTWNLCISGSDENGRDLTNDLSYEILGLARKYGFETPNLTMRCHKNTPEELWTAAIDTIACGVGMPSLYNDEVVCPALERLGITSKDSHRYVMNGCNQIDIQGRSHMGLEDGEVNLGLALCYALTGGVNPMSRKQVGARTPAAESLDTFEEFTNALKRQISYITDAVCSMANKSQKIYAEYSSNPIRSMTIAGCIERGLDYKNRGPLYGHGQILAEGVSDCIDSAANIKKFVYDDKKYTLFEVRDAICADFEGYEKMLRDFKTSGLNFGNDIPYVDEIGADIVNFFNSYLLTKNTERGGVYSGGCSPFDRAAKNGAAAGALPNGKRRSETMYADSIGATPGKDVHGPTALLNSCLKFDQTLPASGFILNLKFNRSMFESRELKTKILHTVKTYFANGGQQLSITVVNRKELLDAVDHPDAHRNIIVRVGGFSAYFVDLDRALQENVIARTYY